jgi:alpha-mannosidase
VATAHLDTQWLWTIQDTINEHVPKTLRDNFALFEKFPDYVFSFEGAFRYMLAKEYYPDEYVKLRRYIASGRWRVCGSMVDSCDVNIPSPQSLIRQILYGNGFFRDEFGRTSCDIFLPDCFGFGYALPAVASHCGLEGFSTQKLTWGSSVGVPFDIGLWEGVDHSTVIAAFDPGDYVGNIREDLGESEKWLERINRLGRQTGAYVGYKYFGVGDTGGAPDAGSVDWLEKAIHGAGPIHVLSAPADRLYQDLTPPQIDKLSRYKGELLMTRHGTGCYTSQAAMKRWNRKNELLADAAERAAVAADWLGGSVYPHRKLTDAWTRFLWHQFHDDLTGTSLPQAYTFSWNDEVVAANQFAAVLTDAVEAISRALDTNGPGLPLVVFNPLSIEREDVVQATVRFSGATPKAVRVFNEAGQEVPSQLAASLGGEADVVFLAKVPSVGLAVYHVRPADAPCDMPTGLKAAASSLENRRYRLTVDENGDVSSVFDKDAGKEVLAHPARLQLLEDTPDRWPEWEIWYDDLSAKPRSHVGGPARIRVVESGPARVALEVNREASGGQSEISNLKSQIRLSAGGAGDRVEFDTVVDWRSPQTLLKAAFPLAVSNEKATYDLGLGTIQRGNNNEKLYEVPAQQWADVTSADGQYGVAILNDCKYGWDKPDDNMLRLTLIHCPNNIQKDIGWHKFLYAICAHKGDWRDAAVSWQAARLNQPLIAFQSPPHDGPLGKRFSLLHVTPPAAVAVTTLKKAEPRDRKESRNQTESGDRSPSTNRAESGNEIVLRVQELSGQRVEDVRVSFVVPIDSAHEVNGVEDPVDGKLTVDHGNLVFDMEPYRPRAFAVKLAAPPTRLAPPVAQPVTLPFDTDVVSLDSDRGDGAFDSQGHSLPGELLPSTVVSEGITLQIGPTGAARKNAVACRGQRIDLPPGGRRRLYLLAASADGDTNGVFKVGDQSVELSVQSYTGFVGQSQSLVVNGQLVDASQMTEPFVKTDTIAWLGTHRHRAAGNEPYVFTYLFKYALDVPASAARITLPDNPSIRILAMTLADDPAELIRPASALYDHPVVPRFAPPGGPTMEPVTVSISCGVKGAIVHYTTDGSEPTAEAKRFSEPFTVRESTTVKAKAFVGPRPSEFIATAIYRFVEPRKADAPADVLPGLNYRYFEGKWSKVADLSAAEPVDQGVLESFDISGRGRDEQFGFEFSGFIEIPRDGVYTFYTASDDASKLFIGDVAVVDNDGPHGLMERSGQIALAAGKHAIRVLYLQGASDLALEVSYQRPGVAKQKIPPSVLFREDDGG